MGIEKINRCSLAQNELKPDRDLKIVQFSKAMEQYNNNPWYRRVQLLISMLIVLFQIMSVFHLFKTDDRLNLFLIVCVFIMAYLITDFVNGLVHMYMDNNTKYTSIAGPFIASFHLHHSYPRYNRKHPLQVYFFESGTKFWLLGYLLMLICLQQATNLPFELECCLVLISILSSVAEVSHYWCHTATRRNKIVKLLQKTRLLLSIKHHVHHHRSDNTHYAFLNGLTNPLINLIARYCYSGYKHHSDQHSSAYFKSIQNKKP